MCLYALLACLIMVFLIFIDCCQELNIYQQRPLEGYQRVENYRYEETAVESAPAGLKQEYRWTLQESGNVEDCFAFYIVHQYAEVYIGGELVYRIYPSEDNIIGKTTACNWVIVPLEKEDLGKEICINVYPAYQAVRTRTLQIFQGSLTRLYIDSLKKALPQIILGICSIVIGVFFILADLYKHVKTSENIELLYLGVFSVIIGVWKLSDLRFSPFMFPNHTLVLSYVSLTMLILAQIPLLRFITLQFRKSKNGILNMAGVLSILTGFTLFVLQLLNVLDFRESLWGTHISIGVTAVAILLTLIFAGKEEKANNRIKVSRIGFLFFTTAAVVDIVMFYVQGTSLYISGTMVVFLGYLISMGVAYGKEMTGKAYIDIHTGLYNRNRCREVLRDDKVITVPTGIIMFDINSLKVINDTWGHEEGDVMIFSFANILRRTIPVFAFVGRYGGDEFIAIIKKTTDEQLQNILISVEKGVKKYNETVEHAQINYAAGYAFSEMYPEYTMEELLKIADEKMYENKREYYHNLRNER